MECTRCGYVMQEYEKECPRCSRMGAKPAPAGRPQPAGAPGGGVATAGYVPRPVYEEEDYDDAPALGWPLTVLLWAELLKSIGELLFIVIGIYIVTGSIVLIGVALALFFTPVLKVAGLVALLREQRWGLYVYCFTTVAPAFLYLMVGASMGGGTIGYVLALAVDILPAIAVFYLAMTKWEILE